MPPRGRATAIRRYVGLSAAGAWGARSLARDERAGEGRGLLAVLVEGGREPRQGPLSLGEPDSIDGEIVHQARVEHVLGITAGAHARRRLLGHPQLRAERVDVELQDWLVAEIAGYLREAREELVDAQRRCRRSGTGFEIPGQTHLHADSIARQPGLE